MADGDTCIFRGSVDSIRIEGVGSVVLTEEAPFVDAKIVALDGARVGFAGPAMLTVERPQSLVPVRMNPKLVPGGTTLAPYDVTYRSGPPIVIDIVTGGWLGSIRGQVPDHPEC